MTDNRSGDRLQFGHRFIDRLDLRASTGGDRGPAFRENRFQQSRLTTKVLHQLRFAGAGSTRDGRSTSMFVPPIGEEFLSDAQNATVCVHRRSRKSAVNLVQHSGSIHLAAHGRNNFLFKGERPRWWRRIYGQVPGPSPSWLQRLQAPIPSLTFGARRGRVDESDTALGAYSESARFSTTTIQ